jgi:hypothetical protein
MTYTSSCCGRGRRGLDREGRYRILAISARDSLRSDCIDLRSVMASRVKWPCFSAFVLPGGAPDPGAPPCILQRFLPRTAGAKQGSPERVLAPQRGLESIGPTFRG